MRTKLTAVLGAALFLGSLVGAVVVPTTSAAAADKKPQPLTWSVQPSKASGELDRRPNFTMVATGGQRLVDYVAISNYSRKPLTLNLYATDAYNTDKGEFGLLPSATPAKDVGAWVSLKKNRVTVPARSRTTVPFSLTVPVGASPGDHAGGIVAAMTTGADAGAAGTVAVEQRVGTRIYLRVLGEARTELSVSSVSTTYEPSTNPAGGTAVVTYTVRNTGTMRMTGTRAVEVAGAFGASRKAVAPSALPELLPGEDATFTERVTGVPPLLRVTGEVTVVPVHAAGGATSALPPVTASASAWALPWVVLGVLLLLGLLVAGWLLGPRSRRRTGPPAGEEADGSTYSAPPMSVS